MSYKPIKCVVFDLDNTIWEGIILENKNVKLVNNIKKILEELDNRGILMSIASKGEDVFALNKLEELGISEFFIHPQINWNLKKDSIIKISQLLNIGIDTIVFIDDQKYELEEVSFYLPEVECIDSKSINKILKLPRFNQTYYTEESSRRREFYISDIKYQNDKNKFYGTENEFLEQLEMELKVKYVNQLDLKRATELINRTNKLNSTGVRLTYEKVKFIYNKNKIIKAEFKDKYCDYGTIGILVLEESDTNLNIKLINFSCRVISRNICKSIIGVVINKAKLINKGLTVEFRYSESNRILSLLLKSCGFEFLDKKDDITFLINNFKYSVENCDHVKIFSEI